jgi:hypothetical protein
LRETANRILVGELYAVLDGQVDADDPGDEIVWPVEFLALALVDVSVIATMSVVRIPVFLRSRARSTVNRRVDEERRERLRCIGGTFDVVPHERESNSPA